MQHPFNLHPIRRQAYLALGILRYKLEKGSVQPTSAYDKYESKVLQTEKDFFFILILYERIDH